MNEKKIYSYIGLAQRAGCVLYGEDNIAQKLRFAKVVIVDSGASDKYKNRIEHKFVNCPMYVMDNLTDALHREGVKAIAITNDELAKAIIDFMR